jgi:hypothetical protein
MLLGNRVLVLEVLRAIRIRAWLAAAVRFHW